MCSIRNMRMTPVHIHRCVKYAKFRPFVSNMSSVAGVRKSHFDQTLKEKRNTGIIPATIIKNSKLSQTCKQLTLKVHQKGLSFKPGQWIDLFCPNEPVVGGFSITSTPKELETNQNIEIVVKKSEHPPAKWCHSSAATIGTKVEFSIGGKFHFETNSKNERERQIVLLAGGIGVTPLMSILRHISESLNNVQKPPIKSVFVLNSAKNFDELVFYEEITQIVKSSSGIIQCIFRTTSKSDNDSNQLSIVEKNKSLHTEFGTKKNIPGMGRFTKKDIISAIHGMQSKSDSIHSNKNIEIYICGPPGMIDEIFFYSIF